MEAGSLGANPRNWRRHPEGQMNALRGVLEDPEIGWAGALLYNERTGRLIDGHARKKAVDPKTPVPVLIGAWSEEAERKILLTHDPLAAMATPDADELQALLAEVKLEGAAFGDLESQLRGLLEAGDGDGSAGAGEEQEDYSPPPAGPVERYTVLIECRDDKHQAELLERFKSEGLECRAMMV